MHSKVSGATFLFSILAGACNAASTGGPAAGHDGGTPEAGDDGGGVPTAEAGREDAGGDDAGNDARTAACAPIAATVIDGGAPNIPKGSSPCTRDLDCKSGEFCYATARECLTPVTVNYSAGDGTGGHQDGGAACEPSLELPTSCDAMSLAWSASVDVSLDPHSLVESDTVLAADGKGNLVAAWSTIPDPTTTGEPQQLNQLAVSHDDGATFTRLTTPSDSATAAANDAVLAYDPGGLWYYVWESYESDFKGAQHVWVSTSPDGDNWSAPSQVDAPGDFQAGGALDFPWVAINPVTHLAYVSYEADPPANSNGSERLVVLGASPGSDAGAPDAALNAADGGDDAGGGGGGSLSLTDGTRPNAYPDLARGAFDSAGSYYAAWLEDGDPNTETGGTLSGSTENAIYFTRIDLSDGGLAPLAANVKVSAAGATVDFDGPSLAVAPDGSAVYVSYAVGTNDAVDILVATSRDRGATWSPGLKVNDDSSCATHFHSSLQLDAAGTLYVFWYDNRDGRGHFFYSQSTDAGKTFLPNRLVSAPSFPFDTFQYSTGWLGDYFEPAFAGGEIYALWSDGRDADQSHAFFAKATIP